MKYQFKTNIRCSGCIEAVTPYLNANNEIIRWEVDTSSPDKILTVETERLSSEMVREIVRRAGYEAVRLNPANPG